MLCIPIIAQDTEGAIKKISEAEEQADICEIRLDLMNSFHLDQIIGAAKKPVIVTYRSEKEGGRGKAEPSEIADYLTNAAREKADYIDVELSMPAKYREKIIHNKNVSQIIISTHIVHSTPSIGDLSGLLNESVHAGGEIIKIVTMASSIDDNLKILKFVSEVHNKDIKIISFCMGLLGRMSRIFTLLMGGYLTFTSLESGEESAPGQIPVDEMKRLLEFFAD